jgi:transcriptional regulator with XRE-family HTH domain
MLKSIHSSRHMLFCESLRRARKRAGLSQERVAERLGEHQSFVSRYETGERRLDVVEFLAVAEALRMDPAAHIKRLQKELLPKQDAKRRPGS